MFINLADVPSDKGLLCLEIRDLEIYTRYNPEHIEERSALANRYVYFVGHFQDPVSDINIRKMILLLCEFAIDSQICRRTIADLASLYQEKSRSDHLHFNFAYTLLETVYGWDLKDLYVLKKLVRFLEQILLARHQQGLYEEALKLSLRIRELLPLSNLALAYCVVMSAYSHEDNFLMISLLEKKVFLESCFKIVEIVRECICTGQEVKMSDFEDFLEINKITPWKKHENFGPYDFADIVRDFSVIPRIERSLCLPIDQLEHFLKSGPDPLICGEILFFGQDEDI